MPRFFTAAIDGTRVQISGEDARHIALSLRMRVGEEVVVCNNGVDYRCRLEEITPERVLGRVTEVQECAAEATVDVTLFQAMPKGEKAQIILQKATELGAREIVFLLTERCIARPDDKSFAKKLSRFQKIAAEAAKQSGRGRIPAVGGLLTLEQAAERMRQMDAAVWCYEKGGEPLGSKNLPKSGSIGLLIGSEGGFSDAEAKRLADWGIEPCGLGRRILRCETAPLAALAIIMNLTGNM